MKFITHEIREFLCDKCEEPLGNHNGWPYISVGDDNFCYDCALKLGHVDAMDWLRVYGHNAYEDAFYKDGVITAYKKWGRGYRKEKIRVFEDEDV